MASQDAGSLRCPHCGAAADPAAQRCPYCRARLATVSCPSCLALMFDGNDYCASCGAARARVVGPVDAKCPGCAGEMSRIEVGETALLECGKCDGLWVDANAFERICSNREAQAAVIHQRGAAPRVAERKVRYRPCVSCGSLMNRVNFAQMSGTVVDVCKGHGTFLDRGELQAVVEFISGGGLERARQRQLEDLKDQERRLRDQEHRLHGAQRRDVSTRDNLVAGGVLDFGALMDLFSGN